MRRVLQVATAGLFLAALGCYHATIDTGLAPSTQTVEKAFASSWIDGLVPPSTVETASKCPHGAAKIETQLSFVNMLVGFITFGIYTPMNIKVTCAQSGRASLPPGAPTIGLQANPTAAEMRDAIGRAAELSLHKGVPVYVEY